MARKLPYVARYESGKQPLDELIKSQQELLGEEFFGRLMTAARPFIDWYYTPYRGPKMPYETDKERDHKFIREHELKYYTEKTALLSFLTELVYDISDNCPEKNRTRLLLNGGVAMALYLSGESVVEGEQPEEWAVHLTAVIREIDKIRREIKARRKAS